MTGRLATAALVAALALGVGAPAAVAQQDTAPAMSVEDLTDTKLTAFVQAAQAIRGVMQDYRPQMEEVTSDADKQALRQEINDEIIVAVDAVEGISVEEYVEIARAAREDQALQERIRDLMQAS